MSGFRIAVLASGTGTNLQAILDRLHGREGIEVAAVASDKPRARALERARAAGVPARAFEHDDPVERAVARGVKVFGVTVHFVDEGVDTGPIIDQRALHLPGADAAEVRLALR